MAAKPRRDHRCGHQWPCMAITWQSRPGGVDRRTLVSGASKRVASAHLESAIGLHFGVSRFARQGLADRDRVWVPHEGPVTYMRLPPGSGAQRIAFTSLFEDREGSIWLCTDGQVLYRLRTQAIKVLTQGVPDRNGWHLNGSVVSRNRPVSRRSTSFPT